MFLSHPRQSPNVQLGVSAAAANSIAQAQFYAPWSPTGPSITVKWVIQWCLGENEHLNVVTALPEAVVTSALPCELTSLTKLNAYHKIVTIQRPLRCQAVTALSCVNMRDTNRWQVNINVWVWVKANLKKWGKMLPASFFFRCCAACCSESIEIICSEWQMQL